MEIKYKHAPLLMALVGMVFLFSCKKTETTDVASLPVVISYLMPGQPIIVKVYQQKDITDTSTYGAAITGLKLTLSNGAKSVALTESTAGNYTYSDLSFLVTGKTYTLQFIYNNLSVSASTLMPAKPKQYNATTTAINLPLTTTTTPGTSAAVAVRFTWSNPDSLYHLLVFKNDNTYAFNVHPYMNSQLNFSYNAKQASYYDVTYNAFNYLGTYHAILYSVNKEYIDVLNSNANTTSQKLSNPPTNITNGYGIFTAMQADTIDLALTQN
jgi:hypothetical protein